MDGIEDEMMGDLKAKEDEILHGETCRTLSEIIQMSSY